MVDSSVKEIISKLVEKYSKNEKDYKKGTYNETQLRSEFLDPFFTALGWDINNSKGLAQHLREVIQEDSVEVEVDGEKTTKKPDYAMLYEGKRRFFVEAKKPSVNVLKDNKAVFQTRRYGWSAQLPISVLSNFEYLVIYDCRVIPNSDDDPIVARIRCFHYTEYVEKIEEIFEFMSYNSVAEGDFDNLLPEDKIDKQPFNSYFLKQIRGWRNLLASNLIKLNKSLNKEQLNFVVQQFINRIVFLRICEDREIEKYKSLLEIKSYDMLRELFHSADKKYNSGLFSFLDEELFDSIKLDDEVIVEIFKQLYYPESPFAFEVIDANVLGSIYEIFLSEELYNVNKKIEVKVKPEVIESEGVVNTPVFIVDSIVSKTINEKLKGKSPRDIESIRILDIACGSGVFLIEAYQVLLNFYLEWYINNERDNSEAVYSKNNGEWRLTVNKKQEILLKHIYGVDIDGQAVEVARFSLLLKVIEDENGNTIDNHLRKTGIKVLPDLSGNILCGNSLVGDSYYDFNENVIDDVNQLVNINPFNWEDAFPLIMEEGGFDVIIGNPPYIRTQNMVKYSPKEIEFYKSGDCEYLSSKTSNFDKYALFIERGIKLLKHNGTLGYIIPNKFLTTKNGEKIRFIISTNKYLSEITDFGVNQIFKGRLTYTCILILNKQETNQFNVQCVNSLTDWIYKNNAEILNYDSNAISEQPWSFVNGDLQKVFSDTISRNPHKMSDFADIFVGIQSSADKIYFIEPISEDDDYVEFNDKNGNHRRIEKGILRPFIWDVPIKPFTTISPNAYAIFPYKEFIGKSATAFSEEEMIQLFPLCWKYLNDYKEELMNRKMSGGDKNIWYRYGRSQSLTKFNGNPKLIWTTLSKEARYAYDTENILYSGGGNGPYYGLSEKAEIGYSTKYIQALLYHPVIELMIRNKTSNFSGGYYSHGRQFVKELPFATIDFKDGEQVKLYEEIINLIDEITHAQQQIAIQWNEHRKRPFQRIYQMKRNKLEELVGIVYGLSKEDVTILKKYI